MRADIFLDTNILLYAASRAAAEQRKRAKSTGRIGEMPIIRSRQT